MKIIPGPLALEGTTQVVSDLSLTESALDVRYPDVADQISVYGLLNPAERRDLIVGKGLPLDIDDRLARLHEAQQASLRLSSEPPSIEI